MRYVLLILIVVFFSSILCDSGFSQIKIGVKSGGNISVIKGLESDPHDKLGWYAGGIINIPIHDRISIQSEILYSSKGTRFHYKTGSFLYGIPKSTEQFNFLNVPILISFLLEKRTSLLFGGEVGYLLSVRERIKQSSGGDTYINFFNRDSNFPSKFDVAIDVGGAYRLKSRLAAEIRYSYGFYTIRYKFPSGDLAPQKGRQRTFQIGLNYYFLK